MIEAPSVSNPKQARITHLTTPVRVLHTDEPKMTPHVEHDFVQAGHLVDVHQAERLHQFGGELILVHLTEAGLAHGDTQSRAGAGISKGSDGRPRAATASRPSSDDLAGEADDLDESFGGTISDINGKVLDHEEDTSRIEFLDQFNDTKNTKRFLAVHPPLPPMAASNQNNKVLRNASLIDAPRLGSDRFVVRKADKEQVAGNKPASFLRVRGLKTPDHVCRNRTI